MEEIRNIECKISMISLPEYWGISDDKIQSCTDWAELLPGQFYRFLPLEREITNIEKRLQSSLWSDQVLSITCTNDKEDICGLLLEGV